MNATPQSGEAYALEQHTRAGASWIYWIAGFTFINLIVVLFVSYDWEFYLALLGPLMIGYSFHASTISVKLIVALGCTIAIGIFALFGLFASKGARWAFIIAIFCYGVDIALWALASAWIGIILHAYAIWRMSVGAKAAFDLAKVRKAAPAGYQGVRGMQNTGTPDSWPTPPASPGPVPPPPINSSPQTPLAPPSIPPLSQSPAEQPMAPAPTETVVPPPPPPPTEGQA